MTGRGPSLAPWVPRRLAGALPPLAGLGAVVALWAAAGPLDQVARPGTLGPGFWPRLVLAGLALGLLARAGAAWRGGPPPPVPAASVTDPDPPAPAPAFTSPDGGAPAGGRRPTRVAGVAGAAAVLLYVALTPLVGFPLATAGFVVAFMRAAGARSMTAIAACAVLGPVVVLYVFVRVVYLPLPRGTAVFEDLTLALYRALGLF